MSDLRARPTDPSQRPSVQAEPAAAAARAEMLLLGDELGRGFLERADRLRPGEEVDVDAAHPVAAELDVAGAGAVVGRGRVAAGDLGEDRVGDDGRLALGEDACLRRADG